MHFSHRLDTHRCTSRCSFFYLCGGTLGTEATTGLLYQPRRIGDGDCGEIGGMMIGRWNRNTRRKPAPAPLWPPKIPHDQTRVWTRAAAGGNQRLTAWAVARPLAVVNVILRIFYWKQKFHLYIPYPLSLRTQESAFDAIYMFIHMKNETFSLTYYKRKLPLRQMYCVEWHRDWGIRNSVQNREGINKTVC
jgi:hypothetical protein